MAEIVSFDGSNIIGDGLALDPDRILESAKGQFEQVAVLGFNSHGEFILCSSMGRERPCGS